MALRYWVGSSGNWSDTSHWSTTNGGAPGASAPGSADIAYINVTPITVTLDTSVTVREVYFNASGNTFALGSNVLTMGSSSGSGVLYANGLTWTASTGGIAISTYGSSVVSTTAIPAIQSNGNITLQAPLAVSGTFTWNSGYIYFGNYNLTCDTFYSNSSSAKYLSKGTGGTIYVTGTNKTVFDTGGATNIQTSGASFDVVANTNATTGTRTISCGSAYFNCAVTAGSDTVSFSGLTGSLNLTGFSGTLGTGAFSVGGTSCILPSSVTYPAGGASLTINPVLGGCTLSTGGQALNRTLVFAGSYTVALGSNVDTGSSSDVAFNSSAYVTSTGYSLTTRNVTHSGRFNFSGSSTYINVSGNWTGPTAGVAASSGVVNMSGSSNTFAGGTYGNSVYTGVTLQYSGTGTLTISGSNTFYGLTTTNSPYGITFTAGTTQTVTNTCALSAVNGSITSLQSSSAGNKWYLQYRNGDLRVSNVRITDSTAQTYSGNSYIATNSQSGGNNTNWSFVSPGGFIAFF